MNSTARAQALVFAKNEFFMLPQVWERNTQGSIYQSHAGSGLESLIFHSNLFLIVNKSSLSLFSLSVGSRQAPSASANTGGSFYCVGGALGEECTEQSFTETGQTETPESPDKASRMNSSFASVSGPCGGPRGLREDEREDRRSCCQGARSRWRARASTRMRPKEESPSG